MPRFEEHKGTGRQARLDALLASLWERDATAAEDLSRLRYLDRRRSTSNPSPTPDTAFPEVDLQRLESVLRYSRPVDGGLLADLEAAHGNLNSRSEIEPPRLVSPDLELWLRVLEELLEHAQPGSVGLRVRAMAARAANHLGYLAFRDGHRTSAYRYYALSEGLARDARDEGELAILLLRKQRLVAATNGVPAALSMVESLGALMTPASPSGIAAWMWGELARHESILGQEADAQRHLDLALSVAERDPDRLNLFAPDKDSRWLARRPAYVSLRLGHADEAIDILERNRADADQALVRETIWNATELGDAWRIQGELDNACHFLMEAVSLAIATEDLRGLTAVAGVRQRMSKWDGDVRLLELDERLQTVRAPRR